MMDVTDIKRDGIARYERFGWEYSYFNPLSEKEVAWYLSWLHPQGNPILELACGTGRLLCKLALAGFYGVGIDSSRAMLAIARQNQRALPERARSRISFRREDIASFPLRESCQAAIIADNSFTVLSTRKQQIACLRNVHRHLQTGGVLLMAVRHFTPASHLGQKWETGWSQPITEPHTGNSISRNVLFKADTNGRRLRGEYQYKVIDRNKKAKLLRYPFSNPLMKESDYEELLRNTGFIIKSYGDYQRRTPNSKTRMLCFVARKGQCV